VTEPHIAVAVIHLAAHHHWAFTITSMPARDADVMARHWAGMVGYCLRSHSTAALCMRSCHAAIDSAVSLGPVPEWHAPCIGHLLHVLRCGGGV